MSICYPMVRPEASSGFPDETNTGPQAGTTFTPTSGEIQTTSNGQIIQNLSLNGYILVRHNNVIIRDCIIDTNGVPGGDPFYAISSTVFPLTGLKILRVTVIGNGQIGSVSIDDMDGAEISYCNMSQNENILAIAANDVNIHDNYLHDLQSDSPELHGDGIQYFAGFDNCTIHHNTIEGFDTSSIIAGSPATVSTNTTITNNFLPHSGAVSYGMQITNTNGLIITGNRIVRDTHPIYPIDLVSPSNYTVSGNVDHNTEEIINPSIS
jgi:hypothetical protein